MRTLPPDRLLCIEEVFRVGKRGVLITPKIPMKGYLGPIGKVSVCLKKPDGSILPALAEISMPHVTPAPESLFYICMLAELHEEDVPIGTEVWTAYQL